MNNQKSSSIKSFIIITVVIIVSIFVFFYYRGKTPATSETLEEISFEDQEIVTRVVSLLNQINSLKIDTALFTDASYLTLVDHTVVIPPLPVGRPNPFAPI